MIYHICSGMTNYNYSKLISVLFIFCKLCRAMIMILMMMLMMSLVMMMVMVMIITMVMIELMVVRMYGAN